MIKQLIYDHFDQIRIEKEKMVSDTNDINFAPSYISSCKRQIYYKKTNTPMSNPIETHSYLKFSMGDAVHESIQNILQKLNIWIEGEDLKEIEWRGLKWLYRIDGKLNINDIEYIIEIKSVYSHGYTTIEKQAKTEHELQLLMYMIFEDIENGIILYCGRDNGYLVEYNYTKQALYEKHYDFIQSKLKDLVALKEDIENRNIPRQDYNIVLKNNNGYITEDFQKDGTKYKTFWSCNYCGWKNLCWKKEYEEIKKHRFFINGEFID